MYRIIYYIGLISILTSDTLAFQIEVKEIASTDKTGQTPFLSIDGITSKGSFIYLVDRVMNRVAVLNNDLTFRSELIRSNNSDASLYMPGFIAVTSANIFVADFGRTSIRIYNHKFDFIKKLHVDGEIIGIATDNNNRLWVAAVTFERIQSIINLDLDGNIITRLPLRNAKGNHMELYYTFCIDKDNYFYIAYFTRNCIEVLHPEKGFVRQFMVPGLPSTVPWSKLKRGIFTRDIPLPDGMIYKSITSDSKGRIYLLTGDYSETPFQEVDICSTEGKFLSWCNLKDKSHLIQIDGKGRLISIEGIKNKVKSYELKYPPSH